MKTKEFIEQAKDFGYDVLEKDYVLEVWDTLLEQKCALMGKYSTKMWLNTARYALIKLCIEYAETPIEEREEVKKYRVILPDAEKMYKNNDHALSRLIDNTIVIREFCNIQFEKLERFQLTETEIKRNHEYLWQFAKEV